jgi:signal transduction histidine kinase
MAIFVNFRVFIAGAMMSGLALATPDELTKVAEIRALSRSDTFVSHPVRLDGVLLVDPVDDVFLQDDTASIWVEGSRGLFNGLKRGDRVEVRGVSAPGKFAPIVKAEMLTHRGTAPTPKPVPVDFEDLDSGRYDAQWVEVEGIVRKVVAGPEHRVDLATGGGRVPLFFYSGNDGEVPVDSKIRVTGIALTQFTRSGQTLHPVLTIPAGVKPVVIVPPPTAVTLRRIDRLMAFSDRLDHGHRVRIRGVITHRQPGEAIWLEEDGRGIRVKLEDTVSYALGEAVEVTGFPVRGSNYSPEMEDAVVARLGYGSEIKPLVLGSAVEALDHDAALITLDAKVIELMRVPNGLRFVLRDDHRDFVANLHADLAAIPPDWQTGSVFRATGICSVSSVPAVDWSGTVDPREFELSVRSVADIQVLRTPPWWNAERRSWLLAAISAVLGLTVFGIFLSARRKLRQAANARRQSETEFAAILSERSRIAREIHDTLAQGLGAISLRLDMMKNLVPGDSKAANHLLEATEIARDCLQEARQSIWNMRSQVIEQNGLDGALAGVFDQLTDTDGLEGDFEVIGEPFHLPPLVENNLLRIGQEAITNAVKHASAKHIHVTLTYSPQSVMLRVKDDGRGFDPENIRREATHFGLLGLRERAHEVGATIYFESKPGHGTEVVLDYRICNGKIPS